MKGLSHPGLARFLPLDSTASQSPLGLHTLISVRVPTNGITNAYPCFSHVPPRCWLGQQVQHQGKS
eukprot:4889801-Amphidinium_carterae.1